MDSYNKKAVFHLPGLFQHFAVYQILFDMLEKNPEWKRDNVEFGSLYGSPTCIWNGGRVIANCFLNLKDLRLVRDFCISYKIPARFTFTNCMLEEKHLFDTFGNQILEIFNTGRNEIICNSEILENYIRENYGDRYKYISSTTKRLNSTAEQNKELEKDYYLVVLDYDHNNNFKYLKTIKNKDKCEILCNPWCIPKCPRRKEHYENISKAQIAIDPDNYMVCPYKRENLGFYGIKDSSCFVTPELINDYLELGFNNFKLEGRTIDRYNLVEVLVYYLIKDTYQNECRVALLYFLNTMGS